jgi:DNA-binding transcriptional LysR family regulator
MSKINYPAILNFITVAREKSFTKAAMELGVSPSAISHTIQNLEQQLGIRLLTRTTRSVSLTEAGERLVQNIVPRIESINATLVNFSQYKDDMQGTVQISAQDFFINTILVPKLKEHKKLYPKINIELISDQEPSERSIEKYDAVVLSGNRTAKDFSTIKISSDIPMVIVGGKSYFEHHPVPHTVEDLISHECIGMPQNSSNNKCLWELTHDNQVVQVKMNSSWTFNSYYSILEASLSGIGLAYLPEAIAKPFLKTGDLKMVLDKHVRPLPGLYLYFALRKERAKQFTFVTDSLKYNE